MILKRNAYKKSVRKHQNEKRKTENVNSVSEFHDPAGGFFMGC